MKNSRKRAQPPPLADRETPQATHWSTPQGRIPVIQSMPFNVKPAELIRAAKELGLEGVITKRNGSVYEPGRRCEAWLKYKINCAQVFVIAGYTIGNPFRCSYR